MSDRQRDIEILTNYFGVLNRVDTWRPRASPEVGWFLYQVRQHLKAKRELRQFKRKHRKTLERYGVISWLPHDTGNPVTLAREIVGKYYQDSVTLADIREVIRMLKMDEPADNFSIYPLDDETIDRLLELG